MEDRNTAKVEGIFRRTSRVLADGGLLGRYNAIRVPSLQAVECVAYINIQWMLCKDLQNNPMNLPSLNCDGIEMEPGWPSNSDFLGRR